MHQTAITTEQLSILQENFQVFGRVNDGPVVTTIGKHPALGSCVVLEMSASELILLSEAEPDDPLGSLNG